MGPPGRRSILEGRKEIELTSCGKGDRTSLTTGEAECSQLASALEQPLVCLQHINGSNVKNGKSILTSKRGSHFTTAPYRRRVTLFRALDAHGLYRLHGLGEGCGSCSRPCRDHANASVLLRRVRSSPKLE